MGRFLKVFRNKKYPKISFYFLAISKNRSFKIKVTVDAFWATFGNYFYGIHHLAALELGHTEHKTWSDHRNSKIFMLNCDLYVVDDLNHNIPTYFSRGFDMVWLVLSFTRGQSYKTYTSVN